MRKSICYSFILLLLYPPALIELESSFRTWVPKKVTVQPQLATSEFNKKQVVPTPITTIAQYEPTLSNNHSHLFDADICNLSGQRQDLASQRRDAIKRLDSRYEHYFYQANHQIGINIYSTNLTREFKTDLLYSLNYMYDYFKTRLKSLTKASITLHMIITPSREEYLELTSTYSTELEKTTGVYFGGLNLAYVDYQHNDLKALRTTIHESFHGLSAHFIGRTARMFNEGMAVRFADIITNKLINGAPDRRMTGEVYLMMEFFESELWASLLTRKLYYSSWAWITFMHTAEQHQNSLINYIIKQQKQPCEPLTAGEIYDVIGDNTAEHEAQFNHWLEQNREYWRNKN
ncbi:hypothetical protein [Psychrobium sp. 1_MG-2023]|uniref:hypothetical protein n=1 Tax=Psychrobium sp. 1_MG-2023 TaxID=3062624 RepID=UPI000C34C4A1|nr:hypothetical protein [Psychrobium sp. 1_MG-2023]MDP2560009.1 hypothetical protein [Psychrobium sp. 1_MG-2023]PKF56329.1 hypothetical protein CW748_10240 [Alteromonadales bacterium alter-6D02]